MLHDPSRHEPLAAAPWDEALVRDAVAAIARDAEGAFDGTAWPIHPRDAGEFPGATALTSLLSGAAGVVWALDWLHREGAVARGHEYLAAMPGIFDRNRASLAREAPPLEAGSYLVGDVGVLAAWYRLDPRARDRLAEAIASNLNHPSNEILLGTPGTALAAALLGADDEVFVPLARDGARRIIAARDDDALWTIRFGPTTRYLGMLHGAAGNVGVLARVGGPTAEPAVRASTAALRNVSMNLRQFPFEFSEHLSAARGWLPRSPAAPWARRTAARPASLRSPLSAG